MFNVFFFLFLGTKNLQNFYQSVYPFIYHISFFFARELHMPGVLTFSWQAPQTSWRDVLRCLATQRRAWKKNAIRKKQGDIGCPFPIGVWKF
jgi:hypothetical protein